MGGGDINSDPMRFGPDATDDACFHFLKIGSLGAEQWPF